MPLDERWVAIPAFHGNSMERFNLLLATCLASFLLLTGAASAQTVFSIDDGVGEVNVGAMPGNSIAFLNSFTGVAGATQIGSIQIVFAMPEAKPTLSAGQSVTAFLWSDPNGDASPTDAKVLGSITGTMATPNTGSFETFTFASPVTLTSSNFFVGFTFSNTASDGQFPAALDMSSLLVNRSFLAIADGSLDPDNLGIAMVPVVRAESVGIEGNWLIRATAIPEPSTYAACLGAAVLGLVLLRRRGQRSR